MFICVLAQGSAYMQGHTNVDRKTIISLLKFMIFNIFTIKRNEIIIVKLYDS